MEVLPMDALEVISKIAQITGTALYAPIDMVLEANYWGAFGVLVVLAFIVSILVSAVKFIAALRWCQHCRRPRSNTAESGSSYPDEVCTTGKSCCRNCTVEHMTAHDPPKQCGVGHGIMQKLPEVHGSLRVVADSCSTCGSKTYDPHESELIHEEIMKLSFRRGRRQGFLAGGTSGLAAGYFIGKLRGRRNNRTDSKQPALSGS
jgi:hypothetical protein